MALKGDVMFILNNVSATCSDPGLAAIISLIKKVMNIIWIIGPILAIIGGVIAFTKLMSNPDEKKYKGLLKNMIIALLMLFFIPVIVNTVMKLFDDTFEVSACWNQAEVTNSTGSQGSTYIDPNGSNKTTIYTDPSQYEVKEESANSGSSSNSNASSDSTTSSTENTSTTGSSSTATTNVIFIGDSRTVGMQQSVTANSNDVWSCKSSMGLDWMKNTGLPNVDSQITNGSKVVILMGVNDLYHVDSYISYINGLVPAMNSRGAKMYFVSVNPTSKSADYLNEDINSFNQKMKSGLSSYVKYIDTNTYLTNNGFTSSDGVHYSTTTYKQIYTLIKGSL